MIAVRKKAYDFSLKDKDGLIHTLSDIQTKYTVLFFYPKDSTPGCTVEAKLFSDALSQFKKLGVTVLGISGGDEKSKTKFCEKHELKVTLLSDPDFLVSQTFECFGEKSFMGKSYKGIFRKTYILDNKKTVLRKYEKVKPFSHVKELIEDIKEMESVN